MADELPLVTVNILSYNRKEELRNTITKVYEQDYKNIEVIVVDNASTDGSAAMVEDEFPDVILIKLDKNIGIAGWNKGFEIAKGEYVLVLDDDSYPERNSIYPSIKYLSENNQTAIVGFTIYNQFYQVIENDEFYQLNSLVGKDVNGFIGCGAIIRKSPFIEAGGYDNFIFLYYNELDISIRLNNMNYKIDYFRNYQVIHLYSLAGRKQLTNDGIRINKRRFKFCFISYSIFLFKNFFIIYFLLFWSKLLLSNFIISIRLGYFFVFCISLFKILQLFFSSALKRNPVRYSVQKKFSFGNFKFNNIYLFPIESFK